MKKASRFFNLLVALSMLFALAAVTPAPVAAQDNPPNRPTPSIDLGDGEFSFDGLVKAAESETALDKIDPSLRGLIEAGKDETVNIYVTVRTGVKLDKFMTQIIVRPAILDGIQNIYGQTHADVLLSIAAQPGVIAIVNAKKEIAFEPFDIEKADAPGVDQAARLARLQELRQKDVPYAEAAAKANGIGGSGWFDVLDGHKSKAAWDKGFEGQGVVVGVLDDGVDFAHPDLQGTYATVTDPESPYYGWPMAFSQVSAYYFAYEVLLQPLGAMGITEQWAGSKWSDTSTTVNVPTCDGCTKGKLSYKPVGAAAAHTYTIPLTSQSEDYKLGSLNEKNLQSTYGERVAILVVDEGEEGVYDTVYVDLDGDFDFTDEKPVTQDSPEVFRDMDGDTYADISGGLLVWISDGAHVPPPTEWLWGLSCGDENGTLKACPDSGSLVMFTGAFDEGYTHGTQCASNVVGQGVVSDGLSAPDFHIGGMVQGGAPKAKVMDFSNHYYSGTDEDEFIVASLGYDGVPMSGDEVQVTSNSYGSFTQMWGSWGYIGRLITALNTTIAPSTMFVFSGGNEGPGYGPQEGDAGPTIIKAGTSTQFGSTTWDSIAGIDQIVYGDPSSFGSKGPNRDGSAGLDLLGNGGRGAGDEGLNYFGFNGAVSWDTWGGTSRSSPVVAGNLALLFNAFKEANGRWPTWDEVMPIAKSSATNTVSSPFLQGGGVLNSDRATDVAAGVYGVYATPDEWRVGDWEGQQYLNFANVAWPNTAYEQEYTVVNPSGYDITVGLQDGVMLRTGEKEFELTTSSESEESSFNFHSPDYLLALDPADIPADAEVMVVRYVHPYSTYDPNYDFNTANSSWRFMLYNWTDINADGKLWEDKNSNGTVNHVDDEALGMDNDGFYKVDYKADETEIQEGEYIRMDYEFGGIGIPLFVHNPLERMADGYFFGFQHRANDHTVDKTTLKIRVEFYKRADWDWLSLDQSSLTVPANGQATFNATMTLPADTAAGIYEGVIYMQDPGDYFHAAHESALPVVVNVINDLDDAADGAVHLGAGERADTLYQNSWTNGYFNWYGGGWTGAGDWRHYFFNVTEPDLEKDQLLIHTFWDDPYPTDINTFVLGPSEDCASNGTGNCAWYSDIVGQPNPAVFGPYTLQPLPPTDNQFRATAAYPFETSTDGPDDWNVVSLERPGLHEIALHNVLFSGEKLDAQFGVDIGTIALEPQIDPADGYMLGDVDARVFGDTGQIDLEYTPSIAIPDLHATLKGYLETFTSPTETVNVPNNNGGAGGNYSAWDPDNVYATVQVDKEGTTELKVHVIMAPANDADLFLVYDKNNNGVPDQGVDSLAGSSGNSSGSDEEITVANPPLGQYIVVFNGYAMDPATGVDLGWWYRTTYPGDLPTEENIIHDGPLAVVQHATADPFSGIAFPITTDERSAGIFATLTNITGTNDVDLYLFDGDGNLVVKSQTAGQADEALELLPATGEYRLEAGQDYTLYVHGFDVTDTINPTLKFWVNDLNMWLGEPTHADVTVSEVAAGETVVIPLMYSKTGFAVGDPNLLGLLIAGPSVMPEALTEIVNIQMADPAAPDVQAEVSKTIFNDRGPTLIGAYPGPYGDADIAPVAPGDHPIYELTVTNIGTEPGTVNLYDYYGDGRYDFVAFVGTEPEEWYNFNDCPAAGWECLDIYTYLDVGETATFQYEVVRTDAPSNPDTVSMNYVEVYSVDTWDLLAYANAGAWNRAWQEASMDDLADMSSKEAPVAIEAGDTFHYTINLHNPDFFETPQLFVADALPAEVEYVGATAPSGTVAYNAGTHTVTWIGAIPIEGLTIDIEVKALDDVEAGTWIYNEATVADKFEGEPFAWLEVETLVVDPTQPELTVTKSVDRLTGGFGVPLKYEIVITNEGTDTAVNAYAVDALPSFLTLDEDSLSATAGEVTFTDGTIEWTGDLEAGASVTITFEATIDEVAAMGRVLLNAVVAGADNAYEAYDSAITEVVQYGFYLPIIAK